MDEKRIELDGILELIESTDEAYASVNTNKAVAWAKFILTDDLPNLNKQRIPKEEFSNLINTGVFMPIKMALGDINDGHEKSLAIGTIAHLKENGNQIVGLAALWEKERPEDVELLRKYYKENRPLELSWEVLYSDSKLNEDGVTDLLGTSLSATTFVKIPAYAGRTPVTAIASTNTPEDNNLNEEEYKQKISDLEAQVTDLNGKIATATTELESSRSEHEELVSLREFKANFDAAKAKAEKMSAIKSKFASANLQKEDEYFDTNQEKLLSMSDEALDFMIQELVAFKSTASASANTAATVAKVPPIVANTGEDSDDISIEDMVKFLKQKAN